MIKRALIFSLLLSCLNCSQWEIIQLFHVIPYFSCNHKMREIWNSSLNEPEIAMLPFQTNLGRINEMPYCIRSDKEHEKLTESQTKCSNDEIECVSLQFEHCIRSNYCHFCECLLAFLHQHNNLRRSFVLCNKSQENGLRFVE